MNSNPQRWSYALDGTYNIRKEVLADSSHLSSVVQRIAEATEMQIINITISNIKEDLAKLGKPVFEDEGGVSVLALISTSHISLHVWPHREAFMLDVVSCREFDAEALHQLVICWLDVREVHHHAVYKPIPKPVALFLTPLESICQLSDKT